MRQWQGQADNQQEPSAYPSRDGGSKWWHVADGQIEDMIRKLNDPPEAKHHGSSSALRDRSASGSLERSVRFSLSDPPQEDALDRVLLQCNKALQHSDQEPRARTKGSWKVPDQHILDFIQSAKQVLAMEAEDTSTMLEANTMPAARTAMGKAGGNIVQAACSAPANGCNGANPASARSRNSRVSVKRDLSARPPWVKSESMPNLFGVDPKGRKIMKAGVCRYEETPIYLSDSKDKCMERVRMSVCGHPYYM